MSKSNRCTFPRVRLHHHLAYDQDLDIPIDLDPAVPAADVGPDDDVRATLDAVLRSHRWKLVAVAKRHLRGTRARHNAEDVVQDVCVGLLEGALALSSDPSEALRELEEEIVTYCWGQR